MHAKAQNVYGYIFLRLLSTCRLQRGSISGGVELILGLKNKSSINFFICN